MQNRVPTFFFKLEAFSINMNTSNWPLCLFVFFYYKKILKREKKTLIGWGWAAEYADSTSAEE